MKPKEATGMKKETVLLSNLNCPSCAADLEKALKKAEGVKHAAVTFATGMLELEYDESVIKPADIDRTVESFGVAVASRM